MLANLLDTSARITVFERGGPHPERPPRPRDCSHPVGLFPSFGYGLGGTTNFWRGGMIRMHPDEFGAAWPSALVADLQQYELAVIRQLYGKRAAAAWMQQPSRELSANCWQETVFYPGEPLVVSNSPLLTGAEVRLGARVSRIVDGSAHVDVEFTTGEQTQLEKFDAVVLAAGALNSPLILAASGLGGPAVGKHYTDHPMGFVAKLANPSERQLWEILRATGVGYGDSRGLIKVRDPETGLFSLFNLRPAASRSFRADPYARSIHFGEQTSRWGRYRAALPHLLDPDFLYQLTENRLKRRVGGKFCYVQAVNEQEALDQGSVRESNGAIEIDWRISPATLGAMTRSLRTLAQALGAELLLPRDPLAGRLSSAAHHCGTTRIAADPSTGVVDANLRVFGTQRVYVADGGVLPSSGASATGLTIGMLVHRLAQHLRQAVVGTAHTVAPPPVRGVLTGPTGAIGQMLRTRLLSSDVVLQPISLREDAPGRPVDAGASVLVHLANVHRSIEHNLELQRRTAATMAAAGIEQLVLPLSFSTLGRVGTHPIGADQVNFGFEATSTDPYPQGKLASERFWLDWQRQDPRRRVLLLYIPTIVGEHSAWTQRIARHAIRLPIVVPDLPRFFAVSESDLANTIFAAMRDGLPLPIERRLMITTSDSLANCVGRDREAMRGAGPIQPAQLGPRFWRLCARAEKSRYLARGGSAVRVVLDRVRQRRRKTALLPVSLQYLHLFHQQSQFADTLSQAADASTSTVVTA